MPYSAFPLRDPLAMIRPLLFFLFLSLCSLPSRAQRTVHVLVPLCDLEKQGVLSDSEKLCSGGDPDDNLYWGARYGVRSFFEGQEEWKVLSSSKGRDSIVERVLFSHDSSNTYMLAEAYHGGRMPACLKDFLSYVNGMGKKEVAQGIDTLRFGADTDLLAFCGHNGLMDHPKIQIPGPPAKEGSDHGASEAVVLACESKSHFRSYFEDAPATPLVWTSGFMSPEAYTLKGILEEWTAEKKGSKVREAAAEAYDRYQDCGMEAAKGLFLCER